MKKFFSLLVNCLMLCSVTHAQGLDKMEWFREAKFGMFIHWGVYSELAGQWEGVSNGNEFIMMQGRVPISQYETVAQRFFPKGYHAETWVLAAKKAGMKYVVYTAKHHEGFAMYRSGCSRYNIYDFTAFKRDPLQELADACRKHGLKLGIYYSLGRDWHDPDVPTDWPTKGGRSNTWDFPNEDAKDIIKYYQRKARPQVIELMNQYNPDILWFDTPELLPAAQSKELREIILSINPQCVINDRIGNKEGDYRTLEQKGATGIIKEEWEACLTLSRNWGYNVRDTKTKSSEKLIGLLIDMVSKGGNLLLNVGPSNEGVIRSSNLSRLADIGEWMAVNQEAIYGTKPWDVYGEDANPEKYKNMTDYKTDEADAIFDGTPTDVVQDIRFTAKGDDLFVIARSWRSRAVIVKVLNGSKYTIKSLSLLGYEGALSWKQTNRDLKIEIPRDAMKHIPTYVFKLKLKLKTKK